MMQVFSLKYTNFGLLYNKTLMAILDQNDDFSAKLEFGLKLAYRRFYEQAAANNEEVVICGDDGIVKHVPAKQILERQKQSAELEQYFKDGAAKWLIPRQ